ncbi:MAG: hypothetical protein ACXAC8_07690 [Candidatus Hodarchaeales archaeon]
MSSDVIKNKYGQVTIGVMRIVMGIVFLWPFFDKLFGLGFATSPENAWINGGSPTKGFLAYAINQNSPFALFFTDVLSPIYQIVDVVFMIMLLVVGLGLITGVLVNISSLAGGIFMINVVLAEWYIYNPGVDIFNPLIDEHVVYALILLVFIAVSAGNYLGLGKRWSNLSIVQKVPLGLLK